MDHVAIMNKSWGLLPKVLSGEKTIESRWYQHKSVPWQSIESGDTVYFKNSSEPVSARSKVQKIKRYEGLTPDKITELLRKYGKDDGIGISQIPIYYQKFKDKKYCLLIFLEKVEKVKPFNIDKTGFGAMSAWISVPNISTIKKDV